MNNFIEGVKKNLGEFGKASFYVRVVPRAKKTEPVGMMDDGVLKIKIQAAPDKGRANKELIDFIYQLLDRYNVKIRIVSGGKSRQKLIEISQD